MIKGITKSHRKLGRPPIRVVVDEVIVVVVVDVTVVVLVVVAAHPNPFTQPSTLTKNFKVGVICR